MKPAPTAGALPASPEFAPAAMRSDAIAPTRVTFLDSFISLLPLLFGGELLAPRPETINTIFR
jgi:hypothetical protein